MVANEVNVEVETLDSVVEEAPVYVESVFVNGVEYKIGKPTAGQVAGIVRTLARLNLKARTELAAIGGAGDNDYIMAFLSGLDEATIIELAALSIGVDKKFAAENFELGWVTGALAILIRKAKIGEVIANFTSMLSPTVN